MAEQLHYLYAPQVLGREITAVWVRFGSMAEDNWLECAFAWIELDGRVVTSIPVSGAARFEVRVLPADARRVDPPEGWVRRSARGLARHILGPRSVSREALVGARIAAVYTEMFEGEADSTSALVELDDGRGLRETLVAPAGTGAAGLTILSVAELAEHKDGVDLRPFFDSTGGVV